MAVADKLTALRIKANLIADRKIGLLELNTDVHDGIAVLTGEVHTEEQKRIAEELAYQIEEVHEVENHIKVIEQSLDEVLLCEGVDAHLGYGPTEGDVGDTAFAISGENYGPGPGLASSEQFPGLFTDSQIEDEVRRRLAIQRAVDVSRVEFDSINQIVQLRGKVPTEEDINTLQDMVLNVRGVMGVSSEVVADSGEMGTPTQ